MPSPEINPIPGIDRILIGAFSKNGKASTNQRLIVPIRGWNMNSQPSAPKSPGSIVLAIINGNIVLRPGRSVRSANQAIGTAKNNAVTVLTSVKPAVLSRV